MAESLSQAFLCCKDSQRQGFWGAILPPAVLCQCLAAACLHLLWKVLGDTLRAAQPSWSLVGQSRRIQFTSPLEGTCLSILAAQPKPHTSSRWDRQGDGKASAASISSTFSNNTGLQNEKDLRRMAQLLDGSSREINGQGVPAPSVTEETSPSSSNLTPSFTKTKGGDQGCLLRVVPKAMSTQAHRSCGDSLMNFSSVVPPEGFAVCALSQSKRSSP